MEEEGCIYEGPEEIVFKVMRREGKTSIELEDMVRDDVVEEIKEYYPEVYAQLSFKNIEEY